MKSSTKAREVTKHGLQTAVQNLDIELYSCILNLPWKCTVVSVKGIREVLGFPDTVELGL